MEAVKMKTQQDTPRTISFVTLGVAILALLLPASALLFIAPVFKKILMESQTALPASTSLMLSFSPAAYIVVFAMLIIGLIVKEMLIQNKKVTIIMNAVAIVSVCPFLVFFMWTMFLPIHRAGG